MHSCMAYTLSCSDQPRSSKHNVRPFQIWFVTLKLKYCLLIYFPCWIEWRWPRMLSCEKERGGKEGANSSRVFGASCPVARLNLSLSKQRNLPLIQKVKETPRQAHFVGTRRGDVISYSPFQSHAPLLRLFFIIPVTFSIYFPASLFDVDYTKSKSDNVIASLCSLSL
jgi:hypothetical protein